MSSPLVAALDQIETQWAALTPPDRTSVTYHSIANRVLSEGAAGDRSFYALPPSASEVDAEGGVANSQVWWWIGYHLRLTQAGRARGTLARAVINEVTLLARSVMKTASWPSGVWAVVFDGHDADFDQGDEQGDIIVTLNLKVLTGETD